MFRQVAYLLALCAPLLTLAEDINSPSSNIRYIRDYLIIPLRSEASTASTVVHPGLKSGTVLQILQVNDESKFSLVKTNDGKEGWISNQYLMSQIPTSVKLQQAEKKIQLLEGSADPKTLEALNNQSDTGTLASQYKILEDKNNTLLREIEHVKSLAGTEVKLNEDNKNLLVQYEGAKRINDTLIAENQSLKDQLSRNTFFNGAIAVFLGMLATLIIQYFNKSRKRDSGWAK